MMQVFGENNVEKFEELVGSSTVVTVFFGSNTVPQCEQIADLFKDLANQEEYKSSKYVNVDITNSPAVAKCFAVNEVPTVVIFQRGNEVNRVVGADTQQIVSNVKKVIESSGGGDKPIEERLNELINQQPVMIFIKGTPTQPRCGFTRTLLNLLAGYQAKYGYFDILSDEEVRQSLKTYSNWPTYPQVYVKGNLVGGLDIIQDLHESGELKDMLNV